MAVFDKLDEKELASLIKRTKILGDKVAIVDKKTITNMSNTFTGIQNAFNSILTYSKNMNKIQQAKLEDLAANTKETQLEAPRSAPIAATMASSDSELLDIIPRLTKVVNELDSELQNLNMSGGGFGGLDLFDILDLLDEARDLKDIKNIKDTKNVRNARNIIDWLRRSRVAQYGRQAIQYGRTALGAAEGLANAPLVEGAAAGGTTVGGAVLGGLAGILATVGIVVGTDKFIESTNVGARKEQEEGTKRFGLTGNGFDGFYINGKGPYTYKQLPEYYQNVSDGYGANKNSGAAAEKAREYVRTHNPDGTLKSQSKQTTSSVVEAPEITVTAPKREQAAQQKASRDSAKVNDKLIKAAVKSTAQAKPVKKETPARPASKQGADWSNKVSSFIGNTYNNVTSFMGGFLAKLASIGSQIGDFLSGGAESLAGLFGFGGGPGYMQADLRGAKGDWARDASFINGVNALAKKYDVDAGDLLGLMWSESTLNPQARNPSGATGLIQFMPDTAKALGTSTDAIFKMNRTQQLALVDKYFEMNKLPSGATAGQLYASVFLPAYARKPDNFVVARAQGANDAGKVQPRWYSQNAGLDMNRDGAITIADLGLRLSSKRQEIGLGPSQAGSGFRALANLATGAFSGAASFVGDIGQYIGEASSYISNSIFGTASKFMGLNAAQGAPALNQFIGKYFQPGFNVKGTPWCAAFANSVLGSQGIKGTGSAAASSFRNYGGLVWDRQYGGNLQAAAKGDIAFFRRPQGTGHVAFVDSINVRAGTITYIGGNQGDRSVGGQVSRSTIRIDNPTNGLIAIRRASGGAPAGQLPAPPAGKDGFQSLAQVIAIEKARKAREAKQSKSFFAPIGQGVRQGLQNIGLVTPPGTPRKSRTAMDQILGYFGAS